MLNAGGDQNELAERQNSDNLQAFRTKGVKVRQRDFDANSERQTNIRRGVRAGPNAVMLYGEARI